MIKIKLLAIGIIFIFNRHYLVSQNEYKPRPGADVYGMDIIIRKKVMTDKCDCCANTNFKYNCTLFKIDIQEVFLHRDSSVFINEKELKSVKYLIISDTFSIVKNFRNKSFTLFAHSTCSKDILAVSQLLEEKPKSFSVSRYSNMPNFIGLSTCYKFNLWQKILLSLNINREKIYSKAKKRPTEDSKFVKAIEKHSDNSRD